MLQAMAVSDRMYVPAAGRIESSGAPEDLLAHPDLPTSCSTGTGDPGRDLRG